MIRIQVFEVQQMSTTAPRRAWETEKLLDLIQTSDLKAAAAFLRALADSYDPKKPTMRGSSDAERNTSEAG